MIFFRPLRDSHRSCYLILFMNGGENLRFAAQETFFIIINVKNSFAAEYFCGNNDTTQTFV